jgi:AraC-like DNA-binding protein
MSDLEILLRGAAAGTALATAAGMLRGETGGAARWTGAVLCLAVAGFAVHSGGAESRALGPLRWVASLLSAAGTGWFLNAHRIAEAKRELAEPARAERSVSEIAFSLGYASLGPFNRAFKEATGTTPSAWRARASLAASPNPEKPG